MGQFISIQAPEKRWLICIDYVYRVETNSDNEISIFYTRDWAPVLIKCKDKQEMDEMMNDIYEQLNQELL